MNPVSRAAKASKTVVIDTDPGVDDALAIMFALAYGLPVRALTTVFGNAKIEDVTANAGTILSLMKSGLPVYAGSSKPLVVEAVLAKSHGDGGFGGYRSGSPRAAQAQGAVDYLADLLEREPSGSVTVVLLGPATNLARLASARPELMGKIGSVIALGGVLGKGNMNEYAEFNALNDPQALAAVLALPCPVSLIPIDACRKVMFTLEELSGIGGGLGGPLRDIAQAYVRYYTKAPGYGGFSGGVMYDLLATGFLARPDLFKTRASRVDVELADPVRLAQTREVPGTPNCELVTDVDAPALKELFFAAVGGASR